MWEALTKTLQPATRLAVGSGLTLAGAVTRSQTVRAWRQEGAPVANDTPAVFAIGR
jgi:16S rRNA (cytidine1402-2'-O)-methyltransferase